MGASVVNTVSKCNTSYQTDPQSFNNIVRDLGERAYHGTRNAKFEGRLDSLLQKLLKINVPHEEGVLLNLLGPPRRRVGSRSRRLVRMLLASEPISGPKTKGSVIHLVGHLYMRLYGGFSSTSEPAGRDYLRTIIETRRRAPRKHLVSRTPRVHQSGVMSGRVRISVGRSQPYP